MSSFKDQYVCKKRANKFSKELLFFSEFLNNMYIRTCKLQRCEEEVISGYLQTSAPYRVQAELTDIVLVPRFDRRFRYFSGGFTLHNDKMTHVSKVMLNRKEGHGFMRIMRMHKDDK